MRLGLLLLALLALLAAATAVAGAGTEQRLTTALGRRGQSARHGQLAPPKKAKKGPSPAEMARRAKDKAKHVAALKARAKASQEKAKRDAAQAKKHMEELTKAEKKHAEEAGKDKQRVADLKVEKKKRAAERKVQLEHERKARQAEEAKKAKAKKAAEEDDRADLGGDRGPLGRKGLGGDVTQYPKAGTTLWHNGKKVRVPVIDEREGMAVTPQVTTDTQSPTLVVGENQGEECKPACDPAHAEAGDEDGFSHTPQTVDSLGQVPDQLKGLQPQQPAQGQKPVGNALEQSILNPQAGEQARQELAEQMSKAEQGLGPAPEQQQQSPQQQTPEERAAVEQRIHDAVMKKHGMFTGGATGEAPKADPQEAINAEFEQQLNDAAKDADDLKKQILLTKLQIEKIDSRDRANEATLVSSFYEHVDEDEETTSDLGAIDEPSDLSGRPLRFNIQNRLKHAQAREKAIHAPAPADKTPEALEALKKLRALINT